MTDKRVQKNVASTLAARELLRSLIKKPEKYAEDEKLIGDLKSQGGLAKLQYKIEIDGETVEKLPMSLNTLKNYSDSELDEGFEGIDSLRIKAREAVETYLARSVRPDSRSRIGLQTKIHDLEEELEKHRAINFILLQAMSSAMSSIKSVRDAPETELRDKRAKDGLDRLRAITSLNVPPFDTVTDSTVVNMKDFMNEK